MPYVNKLTMGCAGTEALHSRIGPGPRVTMTYRVVLELTMGCAGNEALFSGIGPGPKVTMTYRWFRNLPWAVLGLKHYIPG